jgi:hypothetical protein
MSVHRRNRAGYGQGNESHYRKCENRYDHGELLLGRVMEAQESFQTQTTSFQLDALGSGKILSPGQDKCRLEGTFCRS